MKKLAFFFLVVATLLAFAPSASAATSPTPSEVLLPTFGLGLYVGDKLECNKQNDGVYRYGKNKRLYLCMNNEWQDITPQEKKK